MAATVFQTNHVARFAMLLDATCTSPVPVLRIGCAAGAEISLEATSDDSIVCATATTSTDGLWNEIQCVNTCGTTTDCTDVFQIASSGNTADGPYGEIFFACQSANQVTDARDVFEDSGDGSCGSGTLLGDARNFHIAQLGVFCDDLDFVGAFSFAGNFFECGVGSFPIDVEHRYSCVSGDNLRDNLIPFEPVTVDMDHHRLRDACIQAPSGVVIPDVPVPAPVCSRRQCSASSSYSFTDD